MASKYLFSDEENSEIENARKVNKDKRAEARLKALELRAKGASDQEVSEQTGFYLSTISRLVLCCIATGGARSCPEASTSKRPTTRRSRSQKIKSRVEELKVFHSGKNIRLMFQDEAGFSRINSIFSLGQKGIERCKQTLSR